MDKFVNMFMCVCMGDWGGGVRGGEGRERKREREKERGMDGCTVSQMQEDIRKETLYAVEQDIGEKKLNIHYCVEESRFCFGTPNQVCKQKQMCGCSCRGMMHK